METINRHSTCVGHWNFKCSVMSSQTQHWRSFWLNTYIAAIHWFDYRNKLCSWVPVSLFFLLSPFFCFYTFLSSASPLLISLFLYVFLISLFLCFESLCSSLLSLNLCYEVYEIIPKICGLSTYGDIYF